MSAEDLQKNLNLFIRRRKKGNIIFVNYLHNFPTGSYSNSNSYLMGTKPKGTKCSAFKYTNVLSFYEDFLSKDCHSHY